MTALNSTSLFYCPMHSDVGQSVAGNCPHCGMPLVPQGTHFAMLRHMVSNPVHVALMAALMIVLMALMMVAH